MILSSFLAASFLLAPQFIADGPMHRVLVRSGGTQMTDLRSAGAVLWSEDYGGFELAYVDARKAGGVAGLAGSGLSIADEMTIVDFQGYRLDGADPLGTAARLAAIPDDLRAPGGRPREGESRLEIVQFIGPVKDAWLDALRGTGAFVVSYVANDAYVVKADSAAFAAIEKFARERFVLAVWDYHPAFKISSDLDLRGLVDSQAYEVTVQVIADAEGAAFADALRGRAIEAEHEPVSALAYLNVRVKLDGANVLEAARDPHVFAVEPVLEAKLFDERQGQIMANQLDVTGTQPSAPGYLAWLLSKGFPGTNPFNIIVDVTDDGIDRGSTSDVNVEFKVDGLPAGASRVAYNFNYTADPGADSRGGHGNINASIICGYNDQTGVAFEDALLYQYGLGIAPWVKVGNSKVFDYFGGAGFTQPTPVRLAAAWNAGARFSSNSWGYTSGNNYNTESQLHDVGVRDAVSGTAGNQEMTILFAAGNGGPGAGSIHPPGTGKNVIAVGASENWRMTGTDGCGTGNTGADSAKDIIGFSSRGPTSDQRKKPEIVAPGTHIEGAASRATAYNGSVVCNQYWPIGQTLYAWSSGTSHSTPAVAAACALLNQHCLNQGQPVPSPAMYKAFMVACATYMTGSGANDTLWSNNQGFGRVNLESLVDATARFRVDQSVVFGATGETYTRAGSIASGSAPFRVVLTWTDIAGPTTGNAYVNNLDLEVTVNGNLYRGNVFTGASSVTGGAADLRNNTECVFLPAGTTGSYSITVRATNIAGDAVPGNADTTDQDFALLVYNTTSDCNANGIDDGTDIGNGTSQDCDANLVPDECQSDADGDGAIDPCDGCPNDPLKLAPGVCGCGVTDFDLDADGVPNCIDNCDDIPNAGQQDCDGDDIGDICEIAIGAPDCNANGIPDDCDVADATSQDLNGNGVPDECEPVGTGYCFGDGTGGACPCGNSGAPGRGCANSIGQSALLTAVGTTTPDSVVLSVTGELPAAFSLFLQGTANVGPFQYGDGLRCVGGTFKRLYSKNAIGGNVAAPQGAELSITARSAALGDPIPAGATRYYLVSYRDPNPAFCPDPPGSTFNATNSISIVW
jgi:hypothetical protein